MSQICERKETALLELRVQTPRPPLCFLAHSYLIRASCLPIHLLSPLPNLPASLHLPSLSPACFLLSPAHPDSPLSSPQTSTWHEGKTQGPGSFLPVVWVAAALLEAVLLPHPRRPVTEYLRFATLQRKAISFAHNFGGWKLRIG